MSNNERLLEFAEESTHNKTGIYLSNLQRAILISSIEDERKTYDQLAEDFGYSAKYIKQDVAPKLWHLLSQTFDQKITKSNIKSVLERKIRHQSSLVESSISLVSPPVSQSSEQNIILLVDDHPENLKLLSDLLEEQGYEVRQAINGKVALQAISIASPDLILLDISMPELDGYNVCQKIRENSQTQDIPIIFISALNEGWDIVKGFSVGGNDYISKPFKTIEVLARVENQLKVARLRLELKEKDLQLQQALEKLEEITEQTTEKILAQTSSSFKETD